MCKLLDEWRSSLTWDAWSWKNKGVYINPIGEDNFSLWSEHYKTEYYVVNDYQILVWKRIFWLNWDAL